MPFPSFSSRGASLLVLSAGLLLPAARSTAQVTFESLGFLSGAGSSGPTGVSGDGAVVIGSGVLDAEGLTVATRWTSSGGTTRLSGLSGTNYAAANGIAFDGSTAVGVSSTATFDDRAVRWTSSGIQNLGTLSGHDSSQAFAVSGDGSVVVGDSSIGGYTDQRAFRWTQSGGMQAISTVAGATASSATGISRDGSTIVGRVTQASGEDQAFRWTSTTGMTLLGTLGGNGSGASAISADGSTIVGWSHTATKNFQGFRWTKAAGMTELGTFNDSVSADPWAVSADGRVVGGFITNTSWQPSAAFWDDQGVAHDLTGFLTGSGIDVSGWDLYYVTGVFGQDGLYGFIGQGWHNNTMESFRVTGVAVSASPIPEPAHYAAIASALGTLGVILLRRRRSTPSPARA